MKNIYFSFWLKHPADKKKYMCKRMKKEEKQEDSFYRNRTDHVNRKEQRSIASRSSVTTARYVKFVLDMYERIIPYL